MPYARNGEISHRPIEGGVEISEEDYAVALDGMLAGKVVTIDNGFSVAFPPDPEPELPPEPDPVSPYQPLKPYQFWGAVRATGHEPALTTWVAAMADPVQKAIASAMLEFSLEFRRDHPLIEAARVHLEMSEAELNDLWLWGLTL